MEQVRKQFQGVWNIIRFNWHFYLVAALLIIFLIITKNFLPDFIQLFVFTSTIIITITILISLSISFFIYDLSDLYQLKWADELLKYPTGKIVNINAGFDETSSILKKKFEKAELLVFDFYDPNRHTEVSIKRARKAYSSYPNTKSIQTSILPLADESVDAIFLILAAHEIRNKNERIVFFQELKRIIKPSGKIFVTEHLRNVPNFLAYNIGFFHFLSNSSWKETFKNAHLEIEQEIKTTPFITTFILNKNGTSS